MVFFSFVNCLLCSCLFIQWDVSIFTSIFLFFSLLQISVRSLQVMAPHSSTLAWQIPWTEEPDGAQSMGSLGVGDDWAPSLSRIGEGNGNPLQYSCLEDPRDGGAWWAAVYGVAQSRTRLKRLSISILTFSYFLQIFPQICCLSFNFGNFYIYLKNVYVVRSTDLFLHAFFHCLHA